MHQELVKQIVKVCQQRLDEGDHPTIARPSVENLEDAVLSLERTCKTSIDAMVDCFLSWKLPEDFAPDCGIKFDKNAALALDSRNGIYEPVGSNLFTASQAREMIRYLLNH